MSVARTRESAWIDIAKMITELHTLLVSLLTITTIITSLYGYRTTRQEAGVS